MRIWKSHSLLNLINGYLVDSPQPFNLSYPWNFGSLLSFYLKNFSLWVVFYLATPVIGIIGLVILGKIQNDISILEAFNSVEHIMRDVNNSWLIRYLHFSLSSASFSFLIFTVLLGFDMVGGLKLKLCASLCLTLISPIFLLISIKCGIFSPTDLLPYIDIKCDLYHVTGDWYCRNNEPLGPILRQFFQERFMGHDHISNSIMEQLSKSPYAVMYRSVANGWRSDKVLAFLQPEN